MGTPDNIPAPSDGELLRRYVEDRSEAAFTELVQRHINIVYLAALRRVGRNAHAADDVTQKVFSGLARKARSLADRPSIVGWLYTSTRFAATDVVRAEQRRRMHEQEAQTMNELNSDVPVATGQLEPLLDEVMDLLPERDREAVLLHFFEGRPFHEVGATLSLSADATRMRVNRALERLRTTLAQRGITSSAAALAGVLSVQSTLAAPSPLALAVAGNALSNAGSVAGGASLATRLLQIARSSRFMLWSGVAVVLTVGGLAVHSISQDVPTVEAPGGTQAKPSVENIAGKAEEAPIPQVTAATAEVNVASRPAAPPTPLPAATGTQAFKELSPREKIILARLWRLHLIAHPPARIRVGIKLSPEAPNPEAFETGSELLVSSGWAAVAPGNGMLFLTKKGVQFCEIHRAEIEALPVFLKAPAGFPAASDHASP
jgi:RNA polymerase sigma factor (sigma-70 family)